MGQLKKGEGGQRKQRETWRQQVAKRIAPWDSWRRAGQRKQGETWGQEMAKRKGPTWDSWIRGQRANENGRHGVLGGKRAATDPIAHCLWSVNRHRPKIYPFDCLEQRGYQPVEWGLHQPLAEVIPMICFPAGGLELESLRLRLSPLVQLSQGGLFPWVPSYPHVFACFR